VNFIRHTLFILLTMFIFVGSVGVGIYSHFCTKDGIEHSYFIRQAHHCEKEEVKKSSCCQHETKTTLERDCCSDKIQFMQIDLDYFQQISALVFIPFITPSPVYSTFKKALVSKRISNANFANPPPKLSGKEIIIQYQVFLI